MLRAGWSLSFCNLRAETSRELTLPGGQGILKLLLVTGMDKIKDIVSDQLQLGGREAEGCLGGKAFLQGPLTHLTLPILITLPQFMNPDYFPSLLIHSFIHSFLQHARPSSRWCGHGSNYKDKTPNSQSLLGSGTHAQSL